MKKWFLLIFSLSLFLALQVVSAQTETPAHVSAPVDAETPEQVESWDAPINITVSGNTPFGAGYPVIATAPNGALLVGYLRQMSSDDANLDVYYRTSTNNGSSWSTPAPIYTSPNVRSTQLDLVYSGNNNAHAVWVEDSRHLHYARQANWGSSSTPLASAGVGFPLTDPKIVTSANNRLNVIWAEQVSGGGLVLKFLRSENGGSSWWSTPRAGPTTFSFAQRPDIVVAGNTVHLVWEDGLPGSQDVYYARGAVNESTDTITWTTPVNLATRTTAANAKQAQILLQGATLHVSFTDRVSTNQQSVHYVKCSANCQVAANWQLPPGNSANISGEVLGVTESFPYDVVSTLALNGSCVLAYFHGLQPGGSFPEQIMGSSSCGNWAQSPRDIVTSFAVRSANPRVLVHDNWRVYIVYEEKDLAGSSQDPAHIRLVRNKPRIYLPVIRKP